MKFAFKPSARRLAISDAHDEALWVARLVAAEYEQSVESTHYLLVVLSMIPAVSGFQSQ